MSFIKNKLPTLILIILAGYFLLEGLSNLVDAIDATSWPQIEGVVVDIYSKEIKRHVKFSTNTSYILLPVYQYTLNNRPYTSRYIHLNSKKDRLYNLEDVQKRRDKYPTGSKVVVYYNPEKPDEAILDNTLNYYSGFNSLLTWLVLSIPILIISKLT